ARDHARSRDAQRDHRERGRQRRRSRCGAGLRACGEPAADRREHLAREDAAAGLQRAVAPPREGGAMRVAWAAVGLCFVASVASAQDGGAPDAAPPAQDAGVAEAAPDAGSEPPDAGAPVEAPNTATTDAPDAGASAPSNQDTEDLEALLGESVVTT